MDGVPIVEHHRAAPPADDLRRAEHLADELRSRLVLSPRSEIEELVPRHLGPGPTLHIDDLSGIHEFAPFVRYACVQDRARLRAGDGDIIACSLPPVAGYEDYCRDRLGLGASTWLVARTSTHPSWTAAAVWRDPEVRAQLVTAVRQGRVRYLHPHMGSRAVWQLALLLRQAAGRSLQVIAPPPALTSWVNDKVAFAQTVEQLFGAKALPPTTWAANFTSLARRVQGMASSADTIVVKHPESAGGHGNVILEGRRIRGRPLGAVRDLLCRALPDWKQDRPLLVSHWEEPVLQSPSLHVWVPPQPQGPPIVEGILEQRLFQGTHGWRGAVAAQLPECTTRRMVDRCWLMAYLYQRLGYVGRCSFDILLVGTDPEQASPHLLECNGRWGGASLPMTLMNRLFGDWATREFAVSTITPPPGRYPALTSLLDALDAWDVRTGRGSVILSNPGCLAAGFGFEAITLGSDRAEAIDRAEREVPARVLSLLHRDEARRKDTPQRVGLA